MIYLHIESNEAEASILEDEVLHQQQIQHFPSQLGFSLDNSLSFITKDGVADDSAMDMSLMRMSEVHQQQKVGTTQSTTEVTSAADVVVNGGIDNEHSNTMTENDLLKRLYVAEQTIAMFKAELEVKSMELTVAENSLEVYPRMIIE